VPASVAMHGRDHCPGGSDEVPCLKPAVFRGSNLSYTISVPNLSETELHFDTYELSDPNVFEVTLSAGRVRLIRLKKVGIYSLNCRVSWDGGAATDPTLTTVILNDDYVDPDQVTYGFTAGGIQNRAYAFSITRSYPPLVNQDRTFSQVQSYASAVLWTCEHETAGAASQTTQAFGMTNCEIIYMPYSTGAFTPTYDT
jgi:hypothetical protein